MAVSIVSSIIFFLLLIILSQFVDGNVFAAQMEHRKLGGAKKTMTMRRNLEENGRQGSKIATPPSTSRHSGQKNIQKEPSDTRPDKARAQRKSITYEALRKQEAVCNSKIYSNCLGKVSNYCRLGSSCSYYN
ncbi:hypothetical protein ISN45_Aa01g016610 [Arabidopsis thaliana x Arabidopsis arenosa]|uniref:Transmembrane protein n=1 Tax=Arabidopsis thaliana x Arabidopsis arenosa TaxID=1240361 RepID=A0A8T2C6S7_9BRAS|nr:hypothetical protein ISN45_Aa01g016610 [Arabidopsis thaliana x Arabidopsis arenosa]